MVCRLRVRTPDEFRKADHDGCCSSKWDASLWRATFARRRRVKVGPVGRVTDTASHAIAHVDDSRVETSRLEEFEIRRKPPRNAGFPPPTITGWRNR